MIIQNVKLFTGNSFSEGGISFDAKIREIGAHVHAQDALDGEGGYLIPGLIDVHTHAAVNEDASDGNAAGMVKMGRYYAEGGVTSWCPTTMTLKEKELTNAVRAIASYERPEDGAKIAGIHLEGPFINKEKMGAQNPANIAIPDIGLFHRLNDACGGIVRLITMAPETEGGIDFIREASKECTVSVGHTMADYDTAMRAYEAGASHTTHLFNAMPPLLHRAPGVVAAALDAGAYVELIVDGLHVDPAVMRLVQRLFDDHLIFISDSLRCAGMPDGDYELGGQPITMKNGRATLSGTDTLAGSSIHLTEGLRRAVSFGIPLEKAVYAATLAPAKSIGIDKETGSLSEGKCADMVLLDKELNVKAVFIDGKIGKQ